MILRKTHIILLLLQAFLFLATENRCQGQTPVVNDDSFTLTVVADTCIDLVVTANDSLVGPFILNLDTAGIQGTVTASPLGILTYCTSLAGASYLDTFTYSICDSATGLLCDAGSVNINIILTSCSTSFTWTVDSLGGFTFVAPPIGPPVFSYFWNFNDGTTSSLANPVHFFCCPGNYNVCLTTTEGTGCVSTYCDSIPFTPADVDSVWPGDANHDDVVNNFDLLELGLAYGDSGFVRPVTGNGWFAHYAIPWALTLPGGQNEKHADCDGNGVVNHDDTLAISLNYGNLTSKKGSGSGDLEVETTNPPLYLSILNPSIAPGDTLLVDILLGDLAEPVSDLYGIAFSVNYDVTLVDSAHPVRSDLSGSWLPVNNGGNPSNYISITKDRRSIGFVDLGISRTNHTSANGEGRIGGLAIVIIDNIGGKRYSEVPFRLSLSNVKAINLMGEEIPLDLRGDSAVILHRNGIEPEKSSVRAFPNPVKEVLNLDAGDGKIWGIECFDLRGQKIILPRTSNPVTGIIALETNGFASGIYLLKIQTNSGIQQYKIIKQ